METLLKLKPNTQTFIFITLCLVQDQNPLEVRQTASISARCTSSCIWMFQLYLYHLLCIPLWQLYHLMLHKNKIRIKNFAPMHHTFFLVALFPLCSLLCLFEHTQKRRKGRKINRTSQGNRKFDTMCRVTHKQKVFSTYIFSNCVKTLTVIKQPSDHLIVFALAFRSSWLKQSCVYKGRNIRIYIKFVIEEYILFHNYQASVDLWM